MKKLFLLITLLISGISIAQCSISTFIQENYDFDAKVLALREIQNNPLDPDFDNPFLPEARVTPFLEKLSAIYENPNNEPLINSFFNELQIHANPSYFFGYVNYKRMILSVDSSTPWIDDFINTGVSGNPALDNLMTQYQFTVFDDVTTSYTYFLIETSHEVLNINALVDDFEMVSEIINVDPLNGPAGAYNYTGPPYIIGPNNTYAAVCNIIVSDDVYTFSLHGGDCPSVCIYTVSWGVIVSENCEVTLSTKENDASLFSIYPNPVSEILYFQNLPAGYHSIKIYSLQGQLIKFTSFSSEEISVANLTTGLYFIEVSTVEGSKKVMRFIKK